MKRKEKFLKAVQILAPDDDFIYRAARRVTEESLPVAPGGAALEFVVAMQKLTASAKGHLFPSAASQTNPRSSIETGERLSLGHALRIKSAEYWLKLGEADLALRELEALSSSAWSHPWAKQTCAVAANVLEKQTEVTVQE
ncbi:MAG TPA: hypothetical protein VEC99_06210 [Clostridia bacterium]|nr:hypothetical protein [Clostridia bacterium]